MVEDRCRSCWFPLQNATFLFGSGYPGGWIGTGSIAAIYGLTNTLGAYLLGDHLMRRSAGWMGMLVRFGGACLLIPGVALLAGRLGFCGWLEGRGSTAWERPADHQHRAAGRGARALRRGERRAARAGAVCLDGGEMASGARPNPDIDRIERALAKLVKSCREIRAELEEQVAERVG
jgi:hypothetical protein